MHEIPPSSGHAADSRAPLRAAFHRPCSVFKALLCGAAALVGAFLPGCASVTGPEPAVLLSADAAEARWLTNRPLRYEAIERRICECLPEMSGPVRLEVTRGQGATFPSSTEMVVQVTYVETGATVAGEYLPHFLTAQQLFALIRQAVVEGAHSVEADFDGELGYPRRVSIDWDAQMADDEIVYEFEVVAVE